MTNGKLTLLLFGALLLSSVVRGDREHELNAADKRRIIKSMLQSQKDIHKALLKIRAQILNEDSSEHGGHGDDDDDDDDDDYYGGDGEYSNEEEEEYFREQQKKIREVREQLEGYVRNIASNLIECHELMEKIERKIDEEIKDSQKEANYNLFYKRPRHPSSGYGSSTADRKPSDGGQSGAQGPTGVGPRPTTVPLRNQGEQDPALSSNRRSNKKKPQKSSQRGSRAMDFLTQDVQDIVDGTV